MNRVATSVCRVSLIALLAAMVVLVGCHKAKPVPAPPPAPAPAPPPAEPTVTLKADPDTINKGDSATLTWSSTNATQVTIAPEVGNVASEGSTKVTPSESTTYTATASGPGGSTTATARVTVSSPPPPSQPAGPSGDELFSREVRDAFFDFNKSDVRGDAREALGKTADFLRNYPQVRVTIEGHCDERGSTEYNLGLGDRRANAAKQYLVSLGISADRMSTVSFGKEKPFCTEHNEECWQQNRRAHFVQAK